MDISDKNIAVNGIIHFPNPTKNFAPIFLHTVKLNPIFKITLKTIPTIKGTQNDIPNQDFPLMDKIYKMPH